MIPRPSVPSSALLLALGVVAVWFAWTAIPTHTAPDYGYEAWEVTAADGEIALQDQSGESSRLTDRLIDDEIACLARDSRRCLFERRALDGGQNVSYVGEYDYVYDEDGTMYRLESPGPGTRFAGHEPVDLGTALSDVAVETDRLTRTERQVLDGGLVVTNRRLPHADTIVHDDGRYYAFVLTGRDAVVCIDNSEVGDFCESAGDRRTHVELAKWGVGALGVLGVLLGAAGVLAGVASWRRAE